MYQVFYHKAFYNAQMYTQTLSGPKNNKYFIGENNTLQSAK